MHSTLFHVLIVDLTLPPASVGCFVAPRRQVIGINPGFISAPMTPELCYNACGAVAKMYAYLKAGKFGEMYAYLKADKFGEQ